MHILAKPPKLYEDFSSDKSTLKPDVQKDIRMLLKTDPQASKSIEHLKATVMKKNAQLANEVASMIQPVEHKIIIEVIPNN